MSQENVELVKRGYAVLNDAYRTGDLLALGQFTEQTFDPNVVFKPSGLLPESAEVVGHDGAMQFVAAQMEAFETMLLEPRKFTDVGTRLVVPVRLGGLARHTGIEVAFEAVHVWTFHDEKVLRLDMYMSEAEALEAVGLSEQDARADS